LTEVEVDRFDLTKFSFTVEVVDKKFWLVVRRKLENVEQKRNL